MIMKIIVGIEKRYLFYTPTNECFRGFTGISLSVRLSVCLSVCLSFCIQNTSFCQSAGRVINPLPDDKFWVLPNRKTCRR